MKRTAQLRYSNLHADVYYGKTNRERKASTIVSILQDYMGEKLANSFVLDVGSSTGYVDNIIADSAAYVEGLDIDEEAINFAKENKKKNNLKFRIANAMNLNYENESFDIVICNHVYEHVLDDVGLMDEIYRILKTDGICFFTAGNRICIIEPHYKLPLLSLMPRALAHIYMRITNKGEYYHEKHRSYWGLRKLVKRFVTKDYTKQLILFPERFKVSYMIKPESLKQFAARMLVKYLYFLCPTYVWVLEKKKK